MKILALQGSPRKNGNTAQLMKSLLKGAESCGAQTELIHLESIDMKGCRGCFSCQIKGDNLGKCVYNDGMQDLYRKLEECDALVLGSPIYFRGVTSELKAFIDRLFPYYIEKRLTGKKLALIYTQNQVDNSRYTRLFDDMIASFSSLCFNFTEMLLSVDTLGNELNRDVVDNLKNNHPRKIKHKEEQFPKDLAIAFEIGKNLVL